MGWGVLGIDSMAYGNSKKKNDNKILLKMLIINRGTPPRIPGSGHLSGGGMSHDGMSYDRISYGGMSHDGMSHGGMSRSGMSRHVCMHLQAGQPGTTQQQRPGKQAWHCSMRPGKQAWHGGMRPGKQAWHARVS